MDRVRQNLHVVLSMDPTHPKFAVRCESNPAIFNKCTILWMGKWTKQVALITLMEHNIAWRNLA
jgi:dynein heavy chain 2